MQFDHPQFIPYAIAPAFLGLSLVPGAMRSPQFMPADLAGLVAGSAWGLGGAATLQQLGSHIMLSGPLTLGLLCVVIGYYVCCYSLVLWTARRIGPEDLEIFATSIVSSGR